MKNEQATRDSELLRAATVGDPQAVCASIHAGADLEAIQDGMTALMRAALRGHLDVVQCLVGHGAGLHPTQDYSPLVCAAMRGHLDVVKYLVGHGAMGDSKTSYALVKAAEEGHFDVVQYLVESGADVNAENSARQTPLIAATEKNHVEIVEFLLANGADANATGDYGETALVFAARRGHQAVINALIPFVSVAARYYDSDEPQPADTSPPVEIELLPSSSSGRTGEYRAKWLDADVVIKLYVGHVSLSSFANEVELWRRLRHPNVLKLYSSCGVGDLQFFVQEYASNGTLIDYVQSYSSEAPKMWKFLYEAALGLQFLHERSIIHGGLRCSNILIGSDGLAKLTNFSLSQMTETPVPFGWGSTRWMAPELLDIKSFDPLSLHSPSFATDVYSFGMCILEAATKQQPWGSNTHESRALQAKRRWTPEDPEHYEGNPEGLDGRALDLVRRMCSQDPVKRASLSSVLVELEAMAAEEHARLRGTQPEIKPDDTVATYHGGETTRLWTQLCDVAERYPIPQVAFMFDELKQIHTRLSSSDQCGLKVLQGFHDAVKELKDLVAISPATQLVQQLSATCATSNTFQTTRRRIRELWRLLNEPPSVTEERWEQQRDRQIQFFVSEVQQTWLLLNELQSPDEREAFLTFLRGEIESDQEHYSAEQLAVMRTAYDEVARQTGSGVDSPAVSSTPEWFIAWYELDKKPLSNLGQGGYGIVYRARWLDSEVVVKEVLVGGSDNVGASSRSQITSTSSQVQVVSVSTAPEDPTAKAKRAEALRMFRHEVDIWFKLRHPHVIELFGACHVGRPFFVCEYATNGTLPEYIRAHPQQIWEKLRDAALGVQYLHARGVVHGDLKGNNIVVGSDGKAKVTDFGLSSLVDESDGKVTGAWHWVAPECLPDRIAKPETAARPTFESDVYALAMCIVEAMRVVDSIEDDTITPYPWHDAYNMVVKAKVKEGNLPPRPKMCNDTQWRLIEHMCCFNPSDRIRISTVVDKLSEVVKLSSSEELSREKSALADLSSQPERRIDPSMMSTLIVRTLNALQHLGYDELWTEGDALNHQAAVRGILELLWSRIKHAHDKLARDGRATELRGRFCALVNHAYLETERLVRETGDYTIGRFAEAALRALALHRRVDKLLDANLLNDADCGVSEDVQEKCERLLQREKDRSRWKKP